MQYKPDAARLSTMHSPTLDLVHMMSHIMSLALYPSSLFSSKQGSCTSGDVIQPALVCPLHCPASCLVSPRVCPLHYPVALYYM